MSIIKNSIMKSSTEKGLVPTDDLLFFHESDSLGAPYHKETTNLYYVTGSTQYKPAINHLYIDSERVSLTATHSHTSNTNVNLVFNDNSNPSWSNAIQSTKSVTSYYLHSHRYYIHLNNSSPLIKKAIKLYLYRGNTGDELPAGAVVLSDREDIPGCTKMGDNTDQFLFVTNNSTIPSGTDGIGLSTIPVTLTHFSLAYYYSFHRHYEEAKMLLNTPHNVYYTERFGVDAGDVFSGHVHSDINTQLNIDPNTIILRLFKYNNSGIIKEGMIVGSRSEHGFDGIDGWNICNGTNNTPNINNNRCPVINNSKPINKIHNTSLYFDIVNISTVTTDTVSPSVLDHSLKHFHTVDNTERDDEYTVGSDTFSLYDNQSTIVIDSSSTSHNHTIKYDSNPYFGKIIFFKFSGYSG